MPRLSDSTVLALASCFAVSLTMGCGAAVRKEARLPADLAIATVVIYPVDFRGAGTVDRGTLLGERLATRVLAAWDEAVAVIGPQELTVRNREEDRVFTATNLLTRLREEALASHQVVVIRPWVERRAASSRQERADTAGKDLGGLVHEEVTWVGHLEVLAPQRGERVLELSSEMRVDPFERRAEENDPEPEQTRLLDALLETALAELAPQRVAPGTPRARIAVRAVPAPPAGANANALDAEVAQLGRLQLVNPGLAERDAVRLANAPPGLLVVDPADSALRAGDVIRSVNGAPALPESFARARRRGNCELEVTRGGETQALACP